MSEDSDEDTNSLICVYFFDAIINKIRHSLRL